MQCSFRTMEAAKSTNGTKFIHSLATAEAKSGCAVRERRFWVKSTAERFRARPCCETLTVASHPYYTKFEVNARNVRRGHDACKFRREETIDLGSMVRRGTDSHLSKIPSRRYGTSGAKATKSRCNRPPNTEHIHSPRPKPSSGTKAEVQGKPL